MVMVAAWMVSARVAVWESVLDVPVKVMVGTVDGVVMGAVNVTVAVAACIAVGLSVSVEGFAVTPEGRPEMETETEPLKKLSEEAVRVTALLVEPAVTEREAGEAEREKSGVGLGVELPPQVLSREIAVRDATSATALARVRTLEKGSATLNLPQSRQGKCHRVVIVAESKGEGGRHKTSHPNGLRRHS
jgi:hypothetical protein